MKPAYHPYRGDGVPDQHGTDRCLDCFLPETNARHVPPTPNPDVARNEARRLGERE